MCCCVGRRSFDSTYLFKTAKHDHEQEPHCLYGLAGKQYKRHQHNDDVPFVVEKKKEEKVVVVGFEVCVCRGVGRESGGREGGRKAMSSARAVCNRQGNSHKHLQSTHTQQRSLAHRLIASAV